MPGVMGTYAVGKWAQWVDNVDGNTPANSGIVVSLWIAGHEALTALQDYQDLAALDAGTGNTEGSATGYGRVVYTDVDISAVTYTPGTNKAGWTLADDAAALTGVAAGDTYSAGVICYDPDTTVGVDADLLIMHVEEFASDIVTNGSDLDFDFPAADLLTATAA